MKTKKLIIPLLIILSLTLSCKKTVESEKKSFENSIKKANELIFEYPSFSEIIKEQIAQAEAVMNETAAISDDKAKIEKIGVASSLLRTQFMSNLSSIGYSIQSIKSKSVDIRAMDMDYNEKFSADRAIANGESAIDTALEKLKSKVNNKSEAEALSGLVLSNLKVAEENIDRVVKIVKERKAEEKKTAQAKIDKEKAEEAKVEAKVEAEKVEQNKLIKCEYCGTENPANSTKCKNCGAAIGK